jgi:hypothetical protein
MKGTKRLVGILVALGIAFCASSAPASAPFAGPWVKLDGGQVGPYSWSVGANRAAQGRASDARSQNPCLQVGALLRTGPLSYLRQRYRACAPTSGRPRATQPPVIANATQPSNGGPARMSAVGMLVPASVQRLEVTLADGVGRAVPLRDLSRRQARATSLPGYRYAAFVVRGDWCAERMLTEAAGGRTLWDSGPREFPCD